MSPVSELPPILVAEDNDDDYTLLRQALRVAGIENPVLRFRDGDEVVRFLESVPAPEIGPVRPQPWLMFVDITMPIMNGFELLDWCARRRTGPRLRPVVLSGSFRPEDMDRARRLGAADYLVKPLSAAVALATVRSEPALATKR